MFLSFSNRSLLTLPVFLLILLHSTRRARLLLLCAAAPAAMQMRIEKVVTALSAFLPAAKPAGICFASITALGVIWLAVVLALVVMLSMTAQNY